MELSLGDFVVICNFGYASWPPPGCGDFSVDPSLNENVIWYSHDTMFCWEDFILKYRIGHLKSRQI